MNEIIRFSLTSCKKKANASNSNDYVPRDHVIVGSICLALKTRDSCFKDNFCLLRKSCKSDQQIGVKWWVKLNVRRQGSQLVCHLPPFLLTLEPRSLAHVVMLKS